MSRSQLFLSGLVSTKARRLRFNRLGAAKNNGEELVMSLFQRYKEDKLFVTLRLTGC
jgi:hypothetical protein